MLKPTYLALIPLIALLFSCANTPKFAETGDRSNNSANVSAASEPLNYEAYASVLKTYVNTNGLVNYTALQTNPQQLKDFVEAIGKVSPERYAAWGEKEKIAFLINAYNAITLQSIINEQPLKNSIKDIFGVWNVKTNPVVGEPTTLDTIEHQILRKKFNEPRIHAALVCAAISCPPLRQEPFTGASLDVQLDDQVNKWLSTLGLKIDRTQNIVAISAIFKWFGEDWQKQYSADDKFVGSPKERATLNFISKYVSPQDREYLAQGKYKLDYLNYDWALNRQ